MSVFVIINKYTIYAEASTGDVMNFHVNDLGIYLTIKKVVFDNTRYPIAQLVAWERIMVTNRR